MKEQMSFETHVLNTVSTVYVVYASLGVNLIINRLQQDSVYTFEVSASNELGEGPPLKFYVRTQQNSMYFKRPIENLGKYQYTCIYIVIYVM